MPGEADERAAAARAGLDYDALAMASMIADHLRGRPMVLAELPETSRRLITAYTAIADGQRLAKALGGTRMPGGATFNLNASDHRGPLPRVVLIDRDRPASLPEADDVIDAEIVDGPD